MNPATKPLALITGAARRIGAELARQFHRAGYDIALHFSRSKDEALALAEELNLLRQNSCRTYQANLDILEEVQELAQKVSDDWQRCDVLVNNASTFYPTPIGKITETDWNNLIGSNLKAPLFLAQALAPLLRDARGAIINMSDINALRPAAQHSVYSIAKAGNNMLTLTLAKELAPEVRVNGIAPGAILWPEDEDKNEIEKPESLELIPLARLGGSSSIAEAALFLAKSSAYITGQIISVDGGKTLN